MNDNKLRPVLLTLVAVLWLGPVACGKRPSTAGQMLRHYKTTPYAGGDCLTYGTTIAVWNGQEHSEPEVTTDQIAEAKPHSYLLGPGSTDHTHTFTLSTSDFQKLQNNFGVQVTSSGDAIHPPHQVVVNCRSPIVSASVSRGGDVPRDREHDRVQALPGSPRARPSLQSQN